MTSNNSLSPTQKEDLAKVTLWNEFDKKHKVKPVRKNKQAHRYGDFKNNSESYYHKLRKEMEEDLPKYLEKIK